MEFFGDLNLMKTGIVFSDAVSTVSPTYAQEIQMEEQGCGLHHALFYRSHDLTGILNGIDTGDWNPKTDTLIAENYDVTSYAKGKSVCKSQLQAEMGLAANQDVPLIGFVGRLAEQKGLSLILPVMKKWLEEEDVQWVVLGTGQPEYHDLLNQLKERYPGRLGLTLGFSNQLAHQIESAADMFLMPSRYEPCGLNQMYSMAYGTVPIVRATGGLADTVVDATDSNLDNGTANGFSFHTFDASTFEQTLLRAVTMFRENRSAWNQLIETGMNRDWSWRASARAYVSLYQATIAKKNFHQTA